MGFVLEGHSRGASEQITTGTNLRTTSSWHGLLYNVLNFGKNKPMNLGIEIEN